MGGEGVGGEDEFGGVAGDFEELVDAVAFGEVGFQVVEEVSRWWWF